MGVLTWLNGSKEVKPKDDLPSEMEKNDEITKKIVDSAHLHRQKYDDLVAMANNTLLQLSKIKTGS